MRRKRFIVGFVLLLLLCSGTYFILQMNYQPLFETSQFSNFPSRDELRAFIQEQVPPEISTRADVEAFLARNAVSKCSGEVGSLVCWTVAPKEVFSTNDWFRDTLNYIFIEWFYRITFTFDGNALSQVDVIKGDISL